jgi:hypothetical protein
LSLRNRRERERGISSSRSFMYKFVLTLLIRNIHLSINNSAKENNRQV